MQHIKTGSLSVLNCGMGDLEITYNASDVKDMARARRIIGDMLKRGYALFVKGTDEALIRVEEFSEKHNAYVIVDGPTVPAETVPLEETPVEIKPKRGARRRIIKQEHASIIAVPRTAGG